jgi:hypothetical protein
VKDVGSTAPQHLGPERSRTGGDAVVVGQGLDLTRGAAELLTIVAYITAGDGPLQASPDPAGHLSPWHERLLLKAMERLELIDQYMRGRVAFLVAGKDRGYYAPETELELAGAALDTCRTTTAVVDALLADGLPSEQQFESMTHTALKLYSALEAVQ